DPVGSIGAVGLPDCPSVSPQLFRQAPWPVSSNGTEQAYIDTRPAHGHGQTLVGQDRECLARCGSGHAVPFHDRVLPGEAVAVGVLSGADQGAHLLGYLTVDRRGPVFGCRHYVRPLGRGAKPISPVNTDVCSRGVSIKAYIGYVRLRGRSCVI